MGTRLPPARIPRLMFVPYRGVATVGKVPLLRWKRETVWDNSGRNAFVAGLAAGLASAPGKTLRGYGVTAAAAGLAGRARPRVVLLAETAEQARRLEKLLPRWEVRDAVPAVFYEPGWEPEGRDAGDGPPGDIATLLYAARYGVGCDVLVRATGGSGVLNWETIRGGGGGRGTTPALIVDVDDLGGGRGVRDAETRRREYGDQGLRELVAEAED